ncbi:MAG: MiaB/RimO family radical SAM methylthiotransferase [Candidatus Woesebacteria bacterium]|jgi:tRNA-2-methylthio-N6-dimethylallyladenosine synthase
MSKKMKSYYIHTLGCQANKSDSERIASDYHARGYKEAKSWKNCEQLVINTCAVRLRAEHRVYGFLENVKKHFDKTGKKRPKIILTGCMLHHGEEKIKEKLKIIDEVLPITEVSFNRPALRKDKKHAFIPISTGCNSFCSYCIVPYSRGREKSRSMAEILKEVRMLIKQGYSEITLIGQSVNSWGLEKVGVSYRKMLMNKKLTREDLPSNQSQYLKANGLPPFVKLLQSISKFSEIKIIRFLSANPWDFHDELIEEIAHNPKIDRYIHLPIQSGSNTVLHRMNRGYTREDYLELVNKLKKADPDIVLGTDIIVGFPGETEQEFQETVELAQRIDWKLAFVAIYSPRPKTASWRLYENNVPYKVKRKRWQILEDMINKKNLKKRPKVV